MTNPILTVRELRRMLRKADIDTRPSHRLVIFAVVESLFYKCFLVVAKAFSNGPIGPFHRGGVGSEAFHLAQFLRLARHHFHLETIRTRLTTISAAQAKVVAALTTRAALH